MPSYRPHSLAYKFHSQHNGSSTSMIVVQCAQWVRNWTHNSQWTLNKKHHQDDWLLSGYPSFEVNVLTTPSKNQICLCRYYYFLIHYIFFMFLRQAARLEMCGVRIKSTTPLIKHQIPLWYKIFSICSLLFVLPMI